jgi:hypothetical protein
MPHISHLKYRFSLFKRLRRIQTALNGLQESSPKAGANLPLKECKWVLWNFLSQRTKGGRLA